MSMGSKKQLKALANLPDNQINLEDVPEVKDWSQAERGKFFRPVKKQISLRVDADVLDWFKARQGKYQTRINEVLREYMNRESMG